MGHVHLFSRRASVASCSGGVCDGARRQLIYAFKGIYDWRIDLPLRIRGFHNRGDRGGFPLGSGWIGPLPNGHYSWLINGLFVAKWAKQGQELLGWAIFHHEHMSDKMGVDHQPVATFTTTWMSQKVSKWVVSPQLQMGYIGVITLLDWNVPN